MSADAATTMTPEQQSAAEWDYIAPAYGVALREPIALHASFVVEAVAREAAVREAETVNSTDPGQRWPRTILDIGCGPGDLALALKQRFPWARVVGCDISQAMVEQAKRNVAESGVDVQVCQTAWPPAAVTEPGHNEATTTNNVAVPERIDVIVTSFVMQYVHDLTGFTAAVRERLSPNGGRLFASVWSTASENPWLSLGQALLTLKFRDLPLPTSARNLASRAVAAASGGGEDVVADLVAILDEHTGSFALAGGALGDELRAAGLAVRSEATVSYRMVLSGGPDQLLSFFKGMGDERNAVLRALCARWIQDGGVPASFVLATAAHGSSSSSSSRSDAVTTSGDGPGGGDAGGETAAAAAAAAAAEQQGEKPEDGKVVVEEEAPAVDGVESGGGGGGHKHDAKKAKKSTGDDE